MDRRIRVVSFIISPLVFFENFFLFCVYDKICKRVPFQEKRKGMQLTFQEVPKTPAYFTPIVLFFLNLLNMIFAFFRILRMSLSI